MKNLSKEKVVGFVKKNKAKSTLIASGVLLISVLALGGLFSLFGSMKSYSYSDNENASSFDGGMEQDFAEPSMALLKSGRGVSGKMISPNYPPNFDQGEGKYDNAADRKIIKNGNLSLVVKNIENSKNSIENIVKNNSGFISNSNFSENEDYRYDKNGQRKLSSVRKSGYFTVKVPSKNFEKTFSELKKVALKVNNESVSGNDVTEQFADLKTQLKNKKSEVDQYRKILEKAVKVEDVLKVTQYLNTAQTQFERLQGRMNRLSNQVEMSTVSVNITSEKDIEVFGVTWSPLSELKSGFSNMVGDMKDFADDVIKFIFKLPIYILYVGGVILAGRIIWKLFLKLKRKIWEKKKKNESEN